MAADEPNPPVKKPTGRPNVRTPTLGGKQLWADQLLFHDWRIQQNVVTGHSRLLDGKNVRHAWGTFAACQAKLAEIRRQQALPSMKGRAVLVLHGLGRTRSSTQQICGYLRESGDFVVFDVGYPSTRGSVDEHARRLAQVVGNLEGVVEINFVAHSLGNLVIRRWLFDVGQGAAKLPPDAKLGRVVMIGPPNQRPELADRLLPWDFSGEIAGAAAHQLSTGWNDLEPKLAIPQCEFGILAGGNGKSGGNPLIPGDDDWVVSVESTRLAAARDFRVLPVKHTFMMDDRRLQEITLQFLRHGYFESEASRNPISDEAAGAPEKP